MDFKDIIYIILIAMQLVLLCRVWIEASYCNWSAQSKWINKRMTLVIVAVMAFTIMAGWFLENDDELMEWGLGTGVASMTMVIAIYLPGIIKSMSDEDVAEELNIRK